MDESTKIMLLLMASVILFVIVLLLLINNLKRPKKKKEYQAQYPSSYICQDGHKVKSLSELLVDNYFYRHGIKHEYEDVILKTLGPDEKKYKYDWYFPEVDVYIEFFGFSGNKYKQNTEDKINFYRKHHLTMIALRPDDLANVDESLPEKLGEFWDKVITAKHCPNCGNELDARL